MSFFQAATFTNTYLHTSQRVQGNWHRWKKLKIPNWPKLLEAEQGCQLAFCAQHTVLWQELMPPTTNHPSERCPDINVNSTNRTLLRKWWKQRKLQSIVYDYIHNLGCVKFAPPWISLMAPKSSSYSCCLPACLCIGHHRHPGHYWRAATHWSPDHQLPATAPTFRWPPHRALSRAVKLVKGNHSLLLARNPALQSRQWSGVLLGASRNVDPVENVHLLKGCNTKWYQGLHGYRKVLPEVPVVTTLVLSLGGPTTVLPIHRFPAIWSPSQFWNKEYPDQDLHCLTREGVNF